MIGMRDMLKADEILLRCLPIEATQGGQRRPWNSIASAQKYYQVRPLLHLGGLRASQLQRRRGQFVAQLPMRLTIAVGIDAVAVGPRRMKPPTSPSSRCGCRSRPGNTQCERRPEPSIVMALTGSPSQPKRRGAGSSSLESPDISSLQECQQVR